MQFAASSVVESVAMYAAERSGNMAIADRTKMLTYRELWEHIAGYRDYLEALPIKPGDYVLIECDQSVEFVVCMLATQLLGAIAVPIEKNAANARVHEIAQETEAALVITRSQDASSVIPFEDLSRVCDYPSTCASDDCTFPSSESDAEILFSTGTTGKSKGIVITHRNNMAIAENIICGVEMKPDNVEIVPMPLSHSHGLRTTYANLVNGSSVVLADGVLALKRVFQLMDTYQVTSMDISPSILSIIFKLSKDRLGEYADVLDYVQLGSAPLPEEDKLHLARILPHTRLYNFYGSTEAGRSCLFDFATMAGKEHCIGRPAVNASFIVVDEHRMPIDSTPEHMGLLASAGDINMRCYFNEPELTAETMQDGYIYTKDLGYIDRDGLVYMLGRQDDVINFGGVKIAPEEIEQSVLVHPSVRDCACIPVSDSLTGQSPVLCIALESGVDFDAGEFKRFLVTAIDANKQPSRIEVVDEIPRTFNGKVKRKDLIARYESEVADE